MKITRVIALAVIVASSGAAFSQAQSLRNAGQPAEFPPSSYKGTQYVDSKGCVFVRAGISGNVSWIPRVSRSRKLICGQKPSGGSALAGATAAPRAAKPPVQITLDAPAPAAAKPVVRQAAIAPKPKVRRPVSVAAVPKPVRVIRPVPVKQALRKPVIVHKPVAQVVQRKVVTVQPQAARVATSCGSSTSQRYSASNSRRVAVRCGPQAQSHFNSASNTRAVAPRVAAPRVIAQPTYRTQQPRRIVTNNRPQVGYNFASNTGINGGTRIVPKHVLVNRQNTQNFGTPYGYRPVWEDDRLNPNRAEQSVVGQAQTKLIWTQTVPRRLIDVTSGRDVTATTPLVYPYLDVANQTRNLGKVSLVRRDGQVLKRVVRHKAAAKVRQPVVSTRSAPAVKRPAPKVAAASQFVQVGTFDQQNSAQTVAKRIQRMGLPVRIGKFVRSGHTYRMVMVGPFGADAGRALSKLRSAGYHNAVLR
jgi:hypothetical protein